MRKKTAASLLFLLLLPGISLAQQPSLIRRSIQEWATKNGVYVPEVTKANLVEVWELETSDSESAGRVERANKDEVELKKAEERLRAEIARLEQQRTGWTQKAPPSSNDKAIAELERKIEAIDRQRRSLRQKNEAVQKLRQTQIAIALQPFNPFLLIERFPTIRLAIHPVPPTNYEISINGERCPLTEKRLYKVPVGKVEVRVAKGGVQPCVWTGSLIPGQEQEVVCSFP